MTKSSVKRGSMAIASAISHTIMLSAVHRKSLRNAKRMNVAMSDTKNPMARLQFVYLAPPAFVVYMIFVKQQMPKMIRFPVTIAAP